MNFSETPTHTVAGLEPLFDLLLRFCRRQRNLIIRSFSLERSDPAGAATHVRNTLKTDGTWMIVEPFAGHKPEDNFNPIGRAYYGASTLLCTPSSLSQEVGLALGAQAGEKRLKEVVTAGGFTRFRGQRKRRSI